MNWSVVGDVNCGSDEPSVYVFLSAFCEIVVMSIGTTVAADAH